MRGPLTRLVEPDLAIVAVIVSRASLVFFARNHQQMFTAVLESACDV
jgi:hypothetical protein